MGHKMSFGFGRFVKGSCGKDHYMNYQRVKAPFILKDADLIAF